MPARAIVTGIILVIIMAMLVFTVEFFLPLSAKSDMNIICRRALLKMESSGGLAANDRLELIEELGNKGFIDIDVAGTQNVKQGETLNLYVKAGYRHNKLTSLLTRENHVVLMIYNKSSLSRKVVN